MPDVQTLRPKSFTFIDNWNGTGKFSFALPDGSCLYVSITPAMAALANAQIADFVARSFRPPAVAS